MEYQMTQTFFENLSWLHQRAGAGVLMHISCLPSTQGIGCFDINCLKFIDFLSDAGMKYWQICPLHPTSYGDSPYQSTSAFAGNPYFIDLQQLIDDNLLTKQEILKQTELPQNHVDFGMLYNVNRGILQLAASRFDYTNAEFKAFCEQEQSWLENYALFMSLKEHFDNKSWIEWPVEFKKFNQAKQNISNLPITLYVNILLHKFVQYVFHTQWNKIKSYANNKNIKIIGDLPIFVGLDSADVWAHSEIFKLDKNLNPTYVAGVPPDLFSETGQLWGNPVFDWDILKQTDYDWWHKRVTRATSLYDIIRLDHFRGFYDYWEIPANETTATNGTWQFGGGKDFFKSLSNKHNGLKLIAEDLGNLSTGAQNFIQEVNLPGMYVMQFAFDGNPLNFHLPHMHHAHSILYSGTHDNNTTRGWYECDLCEQQQDYIRKYLRVHGNDISWDMIRAGYASHANIFIMTMQDLLCIGSEGRFNVPNRTYGNWSWRMTYQQFENAKFAGCDTYLQTLKAIYGR